MRRFTLREPDFDIPQTVGLSFRWSGIDSELANQLAFQEQFLRFFRHLLENLQSVPSDSPGWNPLPLSLSLRGGAIKAYVQLAVSVAEGALAGLAESLNLGRNGEDLRKLAFGALLDRWSTNNVPREEVRMIWEELQLLKRHRNFIHLGNAAGSEDAYWKEIIDSEAGILMFADRVTQHLAAICDGDVLITPRPPLEPG